jgi:hypothetical protein
MSIGFHAEACGAGGRSLDNHEPLNRQPYEVHVEVDLRDT